MHVHIHSQTSMHAQVRERAHTHTQSLMQKGKQNILQDSLCATVSVTNPDFIYQRHPWVYLNGFRDEMLNFYLSIYIESSNWHEKSCAIYMHLSTAECFQLSRYKQSKIQPNLASWKNIYLLKVFEFWTLYLLFCFTASFPWQEEIHHLHWKAALTHTKSTGRFHDWSVFSTTGKQKCSLSANILSSQYSHQSNRLSQSVLYLHTFMAKLTMRTVH